MKHLIKKVQASQKALSNDLDMLRIMIEETIVKIGASKSSISESMGKSRFYINQVLWRGTTKPEVIIEIAEAVCKWN
jgi:hypothetical protein